MSRRPRSAARRSSQLRHASPLDLSMRMGLCSARGEAHLSRKPGMPRELKISVGQFSDKGAKEANQDFHGVLIPAEPLLSLKGISVVLADGISTSKVSR